MCVHSFNNFGLLWSPISPLGLQGGLSGATCTHCHQTEKGFLDFSIVGPSVWNGFPLNFVLCRGTFPVLFINSSRLYSLAEPGLGAPLSSYLVGALYKLIYIYILYIDR